MGGQQSVDQLTSFFMPLHGIYPAPLSCQSAYLQYATIIRRVRPWRRAYTFGDYLTWAFIPLRRIVPLRGTLSCAFGAALLQGPTHGGLSYMDFYTTAASCASSRHSILRLWRGPSPRTCSWCGFTLFSFHSASRIHPVPLTRPFSKSQPPTPPKGKEPAFADSFPRSCFQP